jgi:hypothetical protein
VIEGQKMKRTLIAVILVMLCFSALACKEPQRGAGPGLLKLFAVGDFVPHVPTVADVKTELGSVQEARIGQNRIYTYRAAHSGWITFRPSEALQDKYAGVEEVIYSRFPPTPASSTQMVGRKLLSDKLMGIAIGDSASKLEARGIAFRKSTVKLFGRKMTAYECTPQLGQDDLFYRYFIVDNQVEAFSMGVTE